MKRKYSLLFFLLPPLAYFSVFVLYPIVGTVVYSFFDKNNHLTLNNYIDVITTTNPLYMFVARPLTLSPPWGALINNLLWFSIHVPTITFLALIVAYVLKYYVKGGTIIKTILFAGFVIPPCIGGLVIKFMFNDQVGIIPKFFAYLGIKSLAVNWIMYPSLADFALILGAMWFWLGFAVTILAAGMETIPKSHVESARVFGASYWQIFWKVVTPQLKPAIITVIVMTALWDMKMFDIVYSSTQGGPGAATNVLALVMFTYFAKALDLGKASAVAVIMTLITFPIIYIVIKRSK